MKMIITLAALLISIQSSAQVRIVELSDKQKAEVVELLISNSSKIKIVDGADGTAVTGQSLASIIAGHIINGNYSSEEKVIGLSSVNVFCEDVSGKRLGVQILECGLMLGNGSFEKKGDRLIGPSDESAYLIQDIRIQRGVRTGSKFELTNKVLEVIRAG